MYAQGMHKKYTSKGIQKSTQEYTKPGIPFATGVLSGKCIQQVFMSIQCILGVVQFLVH